MSTHQSSRAATKGALFILLSAASFGTEAIFIRSGYEQGLAPITIIAWRFLVAALVLWSVTLLMLTSRRSASEPPVPTVGLTGPNRLRVWDVRLLFLGVLFSGVVGALTYSLVFLSASLMIVTFFTYPAIVAVISYAAGERVSRGSVAGLLFTALGVALVVWAPGQGGRPLGFALAGLAALLNAIYFTLSARWTRRISPVVAARTFSTVTALIYLMIAAVGIGLPALWAISGSQALLLVGLGTVATVVPTLAFLEGIKWLDATRGAILTTSEPAFTIILAALFLGERPTIVQVVGTVVVIAAVVLLQATDRS